MPPTATSEFLSGVKAELPILLGVAPFGMIYGALAIGAGLPVGMAQAMSAIVFAGSAQFIAAQLIGSGAPALVLLLTTFIVNIRHMLYSASIAPYFRPLQAGLEVAAGLSPDRRGVRRRHHPLPTNRKQSEPRRHGGHRARFY